MRAKELQAFNRDAVRRLTGFLYREVITFKGLQRICAHFAWNDFIPAAVGPRAGLKLIYGQLKDVLEIARAVVVRKGKV